MAKAVTAVYVEATAEDTEIRLLKGLRKHCPDLPTDLGLVESLAAVRRGRHLEAGQKVLLVLDQFEQWLHAKRTEDNTELVQALRQCDGERVQCVVLVRDDFWMAATRFMANLEISLVQGQNCAAVDLFDLLHARKVLAAFGRAYGRLPDNLGACTKDQEAFLDQAVAGLAQEGKVISVRLALFAEMVKGKPWTPATLKEVGGTEGVGLAFLEETFAASTAPPQHRRHQKAAQALLKALLPGAGTDLKGHLRSQQELLQASGYHHHPKDWDALLRILDGELRLITPTDPEGVGGESSSPRPTAGGRYYQLTHDYLVPSLRDWLTRKQKETRRGRAELLLADRAAVWNNRPEIRQLPSLWQWLQIRWHTKKNNWTPPQRKMMQKAGRYHGLRGAVVALVLAVATTTGLVIRGKVDEQRKATHAAGLVQSLLTADTAQAPAIIGEISEYRKWADPPLREEYDQAAANSRQQLHASLALLPVDASQVDYLYLRLLDAAPGEVPVIRDALAPHKEELVEKLWAVVERPGKDKAQQRLRAAAALAKYDPESEKWAKCSPLVVRDLVRENPFSLGQWSEAYRPVKHSCLAPLADIFRDQRPERAAERTVATNLLADYAADQPQLLADLLLDADEKQFAVIYPKFKDQGEQGLPVLTGEIDKKFPSDLPSSDEKREKLAKRQANAAVALLRMNQPAKVWPLLKHSPDPRMRSYLIHRLAPLGAEAGAIIKRLDEEPDLTIRRALLLSLGEFGETELPPAARQALLPKVQDIYRTDTDPGLHAAAEWLLRTWKEEAWLKRVNDEWAKDKDQRAKRQQGIQQVLTKEEAKAPLQWYVNGQGQTMVVIPGPVEFVMGSPLAEEGHSPIESQHQRRIGRTFALAAKPVTVREFRRFLKESHLEAWFEAGGQVAPLMQKHSPDENGPIILVDWYRAAAYCNWLSQQEGIPPEQWCYETDAQQLAQEKVSASVLLVLAPHPLAAAASARVLPADRRPQVTALRANYLRLGGYRLPTEAEWEYACRAGAVTSRYYGETAALLPEYGWYFENAGKGGRTGPVGSKKPNDLGLFDMQGNVWNWCQDNYRGHPAPKGGEVFEDKDDILNISSARVRVLRGGSFDIHAVSVRSADRFAVVPTYRSNSVGFRPARSFTP
jgi:formylglycine-generating enzyme required for sulfatase activity